MKKLIAMIGAVAMSFGLFAATVATSFEAGQDGVGVPEAGKFTPGTDWTWSGAAFDLGAGADYTYGSGDLARRTDPLGTVDQVNSLTLKTGTDTLVLTADVNNVFLDQLVKFTGFEDAPTLDNGTKIAIWMSEYFNEDETEATTNLFVSCASVTAGGVVETKSFKIDGTYELDKWYRVTVRNIGDINGTSSTLDPRAGFIVYIDGELVGGLESEGIKNVYGAPMTGKAAGYMAQGQLFPAIDATDVALNAIGYKGIGAIDDIIVDAEGPAFAQEVTFTLEGPEGLTYVVSNETDTAEIALEDGGYTVKKGAKVNIYAIPAAGKFVNPASVQKTVAETGKITLSEDFIVTDAGAKTVIDTVETYYLELAEAIEAAEEATGSSIVVTALGEENSADVDEFTVALVQNGTITVNAETKAWTIDTASLEGEITGRTISGASVTLTGALTIGDGALLDVEEIDLDENVITLDGSGSVKTVSTELEIGEEIVCTESSDYEVKDIGGEDEHVYVRRAIAKTGTVIFIAGDGKEFSTPIEQQTVNDGETATQPEAQDDSTGAFKVTGWKKDGETFDFATIIKAGDEITLTADWSEYVAQVNTEKFLTAEEALAKVQVLEQAEDFPITVTCLADQLTIKYGDPEQSVTLAKDGTIEITAGNWKFDAFSGNVVLAPGKTIKAKSLVDGAAITTIPGYKVVKSDTTDEGGYYTWSVVEKVYVAQIGDDPTKKFETLGAAVKAATAGDVVKLLDDYTADNADSDHLNEDMVFEVNGTLDLGGNTLTIPCSGKKVSDDEQYRMIGAADGTTVTVQNGAIVIDQGSYGFMVGQNAAVTIDCTVSKKTGPTVDIYGGTLTCTANAVLTNNAADVFRFKEADRESTVNILGGKYYCTGTGVTTSMFHHYQDNHIANINITGGDFDIKGYLIDAYTNAVTGPVVNFTKLDQNSTARFAKGTLVAPHAKSVITEADVIAEGCKTKKVDEKWYQVVAIQYATLAVTADEGITYVLTNKTTDAVVENGYKADIDNAEVIEAVEIAVTAEGYELDPASVLTTTLNTATPEAIVLKKQLKTFAVTFSTNKVDVAEAATTAQYGQAPAQIPSFTGGTWDVDPTAAVITCVTNFNYTIAAPAPVDPEEPKTYDDDTKAKAAADAINADKPKMIKSPEAAGLTGEAQAAYANRFVAVAEGNTVTVQLLANEKADLEQQAANDTKEIPVSAIAAAEGATEQEIDVTPGFFYSVIANGSLEGMKVTSCQVATGSGKLKVSLPHYENSGFYQIKASVKAQTSGTVFEEDK